MGIDFVQYFEYMNKHGLIYGNYNFRDTVQSCFFAT